MKDVLYSDLKSVLSSSKRHNGRNTCENYIECSLCKLEAAYERDTQFNQATNLQR